MSDKEPIGDLLKELAECVSAIKQENGILRHLVKAILLSRLDGIGSVDWDNWIENAKKVLGEK